MACAILAPVASVRLHGTVRAFVDCQSTLTLGHLVALIARAHEHVNVNNEDRYSFIANTNISGISQVIARICRHIAADCLNRIQLFLVGRNGRKESVRAAFVPLDFARSLCSILALVARVRLHCACARELSVATTWCCMCMCMYTVRHVGSFEFNALSYMF